MALVKWSPCTSVWKRTEPAVSCRLDSPTWRSLTSRFRSTTSLPTGTHLSNRPRKTVSPATDLPLLHLPLSAAQERRLGGSKGDTRNVSQSEGALVRPDSVHYTQSRKPDRPLKLSAPPGVKTVERPAVEFVYVDGVTWSRTVGGNPYWHMSNTDGSLGPLASELFSWGLLDTPGSDLYFSGLPNASGQGGPSLLDRYVGVERLQKVPNLTESW